MAGNETFEADHPRDVADSAHHARKVLCIMDVKRNGDASETIYTDVGMRFANVGFDVGYAMVTLARIPGRFSVVTERVTG